MIGFGIDSAPALQSAARVNSALDSIKAKADEIQRVAASLSKTLSDAFKIQFGGNPFSAVQASAKSLQKTFEDVGASAGRMGATINSAAEESARALDSVGTHAARLATEFDAANVTKGIDAATASVGQLAGALTSAGARLTAGITVPLTLLGKESVEAAVSLDSVKLALNAVAKDSADAEAQLKRLREIAKLPGIGFQEAVQGSVRLQAVGFGAQEAERSLKAFANAIALTGGGRAELNSVTVQLGQLSAKGKVLAQDLRPIIEAAPAVGKALKAAFGTIDSETISKQLEAAGKSSQDFIRDLLTELEKLPKVAGGFRNALDNFADNAQRAFASIGDAILRTFGPALDFIGEKLVKFADFFSGLSAPAQAFIVTIAALAAAIGPLLLILGQLAETFLALKAAFAVLSAAFAESTIALLPALFTPVGAAIAALVVILGIAAVAWATYESAADQAAKITADQIKAASATRDQFGELSHQVVDLTGKQTLNADEHQKLADVLSKLPGSAQAFAAALKTEGDQVAFVTAELQRQKELSEATLIAQRATVAQALADQQKELDAIRERKKALEDEARAANERAKAGKTTTLVSGTATGDVFANVTSTAQAQAILGAAIEKTRIEEEKALKVRNESAVKLGVSQQALNSNTQALLEYATKAGLSTKEIDNLRIGIEQYERQQNAAKGATDATTQALNEQAAAANAAAKEIEQAFANVDLAGIQKGIKGQVDQITKEVIQAGGGVKEAAKLLKERRSQPVAGAGIGRIVTLDDLAKREREGKAIEDFLTNQLTPKIRRGGGARGTSSDSGANALRDAQIKLQEALAAKELQIEKDKNETKRRFLDEALTANLISYQSFYAKRAELIRADAALDVAIQQKRIADQEKKIAEVQAALPAQLAKAKAGTQRETVTNRAQKEIADARTVIANAEREIEQIGAKTAGALAQDAEAVIQKQKELRDAVFAVRREYLELSGKGFLAQIEEDTRKANEEIKKLLVNGRFIAALQAAQNRDTRNNRTRAGGIGTEVDNVRADADLVRAKIQNDVRLGVIGEGQAREEVLRLENDQRKAIEGRLQQQLLLSKGDEKAVASLNQQIEALRTLGRDEQTLREERDKRGFLNDPSFVNSAVTKAEDARRREHEATADRIIELESQIRHAGEDSANRYREAWLKAELDVRTANDKAAEEAIANQVRLQHALDVDPRRLNDGVLKLLASQKTLQESLQDFRANTVQTVFDGIGEGVDKLTEKFGTAGKAVGQLLKDLLKLAATKLFEKLFGLNTQQPAFGLAGGGQQQGGFNPLSLLPGAGGNQGGSIGSILNFGRPAPPSNSNNAILQQLGFGGGNAAGGAGGASGSGSGSPLNLISGLLGGQRGSAPTGPIPADSLLGRIGLGRIFGGQQTGGQFNPLLSTGGFSGGNPLAQILGGRQQSQGGGGLLGNIFGSGQQQSGGGLLGRLFGGGGQQGGGGFLSKIPFLGKLFGGGGGAPGGLKPFIQGDLGAGGAGIGAKAGGLFSGLGGIGASGLLAGGGLLGSLAGGDSQLGKLLGGVGGTLVAGAVGATGIFGGALGAALPALFSNPITAIIGGALIGGALLLGFLAGRDFKKFQKEVETLYKLKVDGGKGGKALFAQVKQVGDTKFAKDGKYKKHVRETLALKEVKDLLAQYGESTGQDDSPLVRQYVERREFTDQFAPANQFVKRATGGLIPTAKATGGLTPLPYFKTGFVPGADQRRDTVLTALRGGEFVTVPEVTRKEGVARFTALNAGQAKIVTNNEVGQLRALISAIQANKVPFFTRKIRDNILAQLQLRAAGSAPTASEAVFSRQATGGMVAATKIAGYATGGVVLPAAGYATGGAVSSDPFAALPTYSAASAQAPASYPAAGYATLGPSPTKSAKQEQADKRQQQRVEESFNLVAKFLSRVQVVTPGSFLRVAAKEAPDAVSGAMNTEYRNATQNSAENRKLTYLD